MDSLATHWSDQSQEANFLMQVMQASVPAGCTPVTQLTDTAFAQPAKAAARQCHDKQKSLFLLKASQQGVKPTFKYGTREMMEVAIVMHERMVQLAQANNTVLAEARAVGWLHFRPGGEQLVEASRQKWAGNLRESTRKIAPDLMKRRAETVKDGKPVLDYGVDKLQPERLENSYFDDGDGGDGDLVLDAGQEVLDLVESRRLDAALLHPSVRAEVEQKLAEVALVSSQKPRTVKEGTPRKHKATRSERALEWKGEIRKTVAFRLAKMSPYSKSDKKKVKKHAFKSWEHVIQVFAFRIQADA